MVDGRRLRGHVATSFDIDDNTLIDSGNGLYIAWARHGRNPCAGNTKMLGVGRRSVEVIISEIGLDMSRFTLTVTSPPWNTGIGLEARDFLGKVAEILGIRLRPLDNDETD